MQGSVSTFTQPTIYVVATDYTGTRAGLTAAIPLAKGAGARLVLLVPHVVPYPLPVDQPVDSGQFVVRRYRDLVAELNGVVQIRLCLCRRPGDVLSQLSPSATVVLGGPAGRWVPSAAVRLARRLAHLGHRVVFTPVDTHVPSPGQFAAMVIASCVFMLTGVAHAQEQAAAPPAAQDAADTSAQPAESPLDGVTFGIGLDAYYAWNVNRPVGRVNLLRAYDVSSNSFSLNQANVIVERGIDVAKQRRAGLRLDLMFGQATETLQGSASNEPRPQVYRQLFQAYGSYLFPVGKGLQVDFGKFASALGFENNYTKDQINYSRSFLFNFLPFYHMGLRSTYTPSEKVSLTYWLVNGAQQAEDFNGFKSQAAIVTIKPVPSVSFNVNYYHGRESRDLTPALNPGLPALPTQPGLSVESVAALDRSRPHIVDSYISWTKRAVTLGAEGDYVAVKPVSGESAVVKGAALYAQYRVAPEAQIALRYEYFVDRSGLFGGVAQTLHEATATATYRLGDGVQLRSEWRRDASDRDFFLGASLAERRRAQQTLTGALVWWFGTKTGTW